jgi:hypothetical protein
MWTVIIIAVVIAIPSLLVWFIVGILDKSSLMKKIASIFNEWFQMSPA